MKQQAIPRRARTDRLVAQVRSIGALFREPVRDRTGLRGVPQIEEITIGPDFRVSRLIAIGPRRLAFHRPLTGRSDEEELVTAIGSSIIRAHRGRPLHPYWMELKVGVVSPYDDSGIVPFPLPYPAQGLGHRDVAHIPNLTNTDDDVRLRLRYCQQRVAQDLSRTQRPIIVVTRRRRGI